MKPKVEVIQQWAVRFHYEDGSTKDGFMFNTQAEALAKVESLKKKGLIE